MDEIDFGSFKNRKTLVSKQPFVGGSPKAKEIIDFFKLPAGTTEFLVRIGKEGLVEIVVTFHPYETDVGVQEALPKEELNG